MFRLLCLLFLFLSLSFFFFFPFSFFFPVPKSFPNPSRNDTSKKKSVVKIAWICVVKIAYSDFTTPSNKPLRMSYVTFVLRLQGRFIFWFPWLRSIQMTPLKLRSSGRQRSSTSSRKRFRNLWLRS